MVPVALTTAATSTVGSNESRGGVGTLIERWDGSVWTRYRKL